MRSSNRFLSLWISLACMVVLMFFVWFTVKSIALLFIIYGLVFVYAICFLWMFSKQTQAIIYFSIDTFYLVKFYLEKKMMLEKEISKEILNSLMQDPDFVCEISIRQEITWYATHTKISQTKRYEENGKVIERTEESESDSFDLAERWFWDFSLGDYLSDSDYERAFLRKGQNCGSEYIRIDLKRGVIRIYGEGGRFGETIRRINGRELKINKPENFWLIASPENLGRLNFSHQTTNADGRGGKHFEQSDEFKSWKVTGDDWEIPSHWSYSIHEL